MTEPAGLKIRPEEFEALAHRWPRLPEHVQAEWLDKMSRAQKKRFERTVAEVQLGQKHFAGKLTTRQDVVAMLAMHTNLHILPLAARMDMMEQALEFHRRPWYRKLRVSLAVRWALVLQWLERKGIRFYAINQESTNGEGAAVDQRGALGSEGGLPEGPDQDAARGHERDRLHGSGRDPAVGGRGGERQAADGDAGRLRDHGREPAGPSSGADPGDENDQAPQEGRGLIEVVKR